MRGEQRVTEIMSDTPSGPNSTVVCPVCESERIERLGDSAGELDYRCLDCEAEFDEEGGRGIIA
jgi:rubredoxin